MCQSMEVVSYFIICNKISSPLVYISNVMSEILMNLHIGSKSHDTYYQIERFCIIKIDAESSSQIIIQ